MTWAISRSEFEGMRKRLLRMRSFYPVNVWLGNPSKKFTLNLFISDEKPSYQLLRNGSHLTVLVGDPSFEEVRDHMEEFANNELVRKVMSL